VHLLGHGLHCRLLTPQLVLLLLLLLLLLLHLHGTRPADAC
jgi:hypothetical protein